MDLDPNVLSAQQQMLADFGAANTALSVDSTNAAALASAQDAKDKSAQALVDAKKKAAGSLAGLEAALTTKYTIA